MKMDIAAGHYTDTNILQEPMGYVDGANLYQFVDSNPVALVDPAGLQAQPPSQSNYADYTEKPEVSKAYGIRFVVWW